MKLWDLLDNMCVVVDLKFEQKTRWKIKADDSLGLSHISGQNKGILRVHRVF
jgi:hypothetical protein